MTRILKNNALLILECLLRILKRHPVFCDIVQVLAVVPFKIRRFHSPNVLQTATFVNEKISCDTPAIPIRTPTQATEIGLTLDAIEVEAESVSYIVAARLALETSSDAYLAGYTKNGQIPAGVSLDLIAKVAGRITEMGEHLLPKRKLKGKESEAD